MRNTNTDDDLNNNDTPLSQDDINDRAHDAAKSGNIILAETLRRQHHADLNAITYGAASGNQTHYLEKILILNLLQYPRTAAEIDSRIKHIRDKNLSPEEKWPMIRISDLTITKAKNALVLKNLPLRITTDEACNLVHSGNWGALVLLANLQHGRIHRKTTEEVKNNFLPFRVWIRILEFTLGIHNRVVENKEQSENIWNTTLMGQLGNFFHSVMQSPKLLTENKNTSFLATRRQRT